jgi:hypothetical protein
MQTLQKTADFSKFRLVSTNRIVDSKHVKRLKAAIAKKNLLHLNPILVNSKMEVIDGQHRLRAAEELEIEVFYIMSDQIAQEDIAALNSNKKNWALLDYIQYHAKNGLNTYKALHTFMKNNSFIPPSVAISIACVDEKSDTIRDGKLTGVNLDEAEALLERINDYRNHFEYAYTRKFVLAIKAIEKVEGFNHVQMIEQIGEQPRSLKPCTTSKEYVKNLEELYNYRKQKRVRFY